MPSTAPATAAEPVEAAFTPAVPLDELYCPKCSYSLRGAAGPRCPECGYDLNYLTTPEVTIPWEHRRRLGRVRAYLQTVWLVTFRHRRFCENYAKRVDYRSARRFQLVTVMLAWLPFVYEAVFVFLFVEQTARGKLPARESGIMSKGPGLADALAQLHWLIIPLLGCILLLLLTVTGAASYFFHPKTLSVPRQNTALAMSYYGWASLPWAVLLASILLHVLFARVEFAAWQSPVFSSTVLSICLGTMTYLPAIWVAQIVSCVMPQLKARSELLLVYLVGCWVASAALFVIVLPAALVGLFLIVASFLR